MGDNVAGVIQWPIRPEGPAVKRPGRQAGMKMDLKSERRRCGMVDLKCV